VIVAGTDAVILNRVSVKICAPQFAQFGYQARGNENNVVGPKTEVIISGMTGPALHLQ
jgi:hypothetical protein